MQATYSAGTQVNVKKYSWNLTQDTQEPAKVIRTSKAMQPLPAGYFPVRFDADGAVLLVHQSRLSAKSPT